jgi:glycosyltransferase involved in cell wall biosynthesis
MKNEPLVSIIMNCHNGEKYLKDSLSSIIKQKYKNWELIFWDNKSNDRSSEILKSFTDKRIRYYYTNKKTELYEARNLAIKKAKGKFISFLDVDDIWFPNKLKLQVSKFKNKDVGLVYGKYYKINKSNIIRKKQLIKKKNLPTGSITSFLLKEYYIGLLTIIVRKSFLKKNAFRVKYNYLSDLDFVLNFSLKYKFEAIQKPIAVYRQHENQMQRKYYKIKSIQFEKWYKEITKLKTFGEKKNLKLFQEWNRFYKTISLIKSKNYFKAFFALVRYPLNFNKFKLFIIFCLPNFISKNIINET